MVYIFHNDFRHLHTFSLREATDSFPCKIQKENGVGCDSVVSHAKTPSSALLLEDDSAILLLLEDRPEGSRSPRPEDSVNPLLLRLLLLLDRCSPSSPRLRRSDGSLVLLFALLADEEDLCREDEERTLDELRRERLALIFLCIMARRLRRLVNSMPRNMNRLPMRQSIPRVYLALLATLKLVKEWEAEEMEFIRLPKLLIRDVLVQMGLSRAVHDLLEAIKAPAVA